jgi:hypothetical protein
MDSWHSFGARRAFFEDLELSGFDDVYRLVDVARNALWCEEPDCHHALQNAIFGQTLQAEPLEQMYVRGKLINLHASGLIRLVEFPVGAYPQRDVKIAENQAALNVGLGPTGLCPIVNPAKGSTDDGSVSWARPLTFTSTGSGEGEPTRSDMTLRPGSAPLEIGYTMPSRTWTHLSVTGSVWRWPYGSASIWLLANVTPLP